MLHLLLWPVRFAEHLLANLLFPGDDLHFLVCSCPKGDPANWIPEMGLDR